jgi:hypothetical protein
LHNFYVYLLSCVHSNSTMNNTTTVNNNRIWPAKNENAFIVLEVVYQINVCLFATVGIICNITAILTFKRQGTKNSIFRWSIFELKTHVIYLILSVCLVFLRCNKFCLYENHSKPMANKIEFSSYFFDDENTRLCH